MENIEINIEEIKPYENNAKEHPDSQLKTLAYSLKNYGWQSPIIVDKNNVIIAGHGRIEAYKKYPEGIETPWIKNNEGETLSGKPGKKLTPKQVKELRLADNKTNESPWLNELLLPELKELQLEGTDIEDLGFDKDLIIEPEEKDDQVPEVPEEPKANLGDIYQLGNHRIMCGDSTKLEDVEKLMDGKKGKVIFTSPPYNINSGMYESYEDNLKSEEYIDFNINIINIWKKHLKGFIFWNISYNKNSRWEFIEIFYRIVKETGLKFLELIVWNKKQALPITSKEMFTRQYEDVLLVGDEHSIQEDLDMFVCARNDKKAFFNKKTNRGITNYWEIGTNKTQLKNHLACYPVMLPVKGIILMSNEKDIVMDPFIGSGSTLIACEKTNRICYGMELDPKYIDVIIKRYEDYTGNKAIKL